MEKSGKKILFGVGALVSVCLGLILLIAFIPSIVRLFPATHFRGEAPVEAIADFDKYFNDFESVKSFVLKGYSELPKSEEGESGRTFMVDIDEGYITHSRYDMSSYSFVRIPFESDESTKSSIKNLKGFYESSEDYEDMMINVLNGNVRFITWGERIIYTPDNSVPTFNYHPRESDGDYAVYKLRDNWFIAE